ncbi:carboxypeptidase Q [Suncus etruscus]|uniref:carboxypeptidase Q n=1 Tax=Suncus etruscus TaxID=109475 RepID=UPI00210F2F34|nr:carboxypeptidase Q [Suncus etruscus]
MQYLPFLLLTILGITQLSPLSSGKAIGKPSLSEQTIKDVEAEIFSYKAVAKALIHMAVEGKAQNRSYERLSLLVDMVGPRLSGSKNLEQAIQVLYHSLKEDRLQNVHLEPVKVPHWERGEESALMKAPRRQPMAILGLGNSIGTPPNGITAEVLVVTSFSELQQRALEAKGKIVVYNQPFISYQETVKYRTQGAVQAALVGAVAALVRSVTPFSIYSPHTGILEYQEDVPKIPSACITVEDAEMMGRLASQGLRIVIQLKMCEKKYPDADSFNTVAEITGWKYPDEVVLISGHLDSWDVGQGALDDGVGAFISWEALSLIKDLDLRPKRTLRLVFWTAEEQGGIGSLQYYLQHKGNISKYSLVMESDLGTFFPIGLQFTGSEEAKAIMREIVKLLQPLNITQLLDGGEGTDINFWIQAGVPGKKKLSRAT